VWESLASVSVFVLILGTIVIVSLLSLIVIHQIVTVSTIIATVSYQALGIDVIVMAMMLLCAWAVSVTVSPVSPVITIVTSIIKENPFKVILRWNLHYALILALVHSVVIYGMHVFWFSYQFNNWLKKVFEEANSRFQRNHPFSLKRDIASMRLLTCSLSKITDI